ncbi:102aa long hypothetical protein [Pyrococcus horikoshii OT3]|uniref:Uncharacterized protein n=1 Tax=Pyrococcus horikoshii (strain ATCC 700860 / DSM 12428 / JCM 9974 / NBRC 100139 / OT-3) TaxID=70601 RepID=O58485_PYRHO|nr:102aa long hypothetical protein [Pyrococcus horikoshii OT3]
MFAPETTLIVISVSSPSISLCLLISLDTFTSIAGLKKSAENRKTKRTGRVSTIPSHLNRRYEDITIIQIMVNSEYAFPVAFISPHSNFGTGTLSRIFSITLS